MALPVIFENNNDDDKAVTHCQHSESSSPSKKLKYASSRFEVIRSPIEFNRGIQECPSEQTICAVSSRQQLTSIEEDEDPCPGNSLTTRLSNAMRDYARGAVLTGRRRHPQSGFGRNCCCSLSILRPIKALFRFCRNIWKGALVVLAPSLLLPMYFSEKSEYRCLFCVLVMAIYWATEVIPLAVTALLPFVLFPLADLLPAKTVAREYMNDTNFLLIGGLIMACAVEKSNLHERLALRVLTLVSSNPKWIMLSFMGVTAILSMFISNTATTAMMVPIGQSVIKQLLIRQKSEIDLLKGPSSNPTDDECLGKKESRIAKAIVLSICFASNIGGTGTLTGTPPNLVMTGMLPTLFPGQNFGVNFFSWMAFAIPLMILCLMTCWIILCLLFVRTPFTVQNGNELNRLLMERYQNLSNMSFAERSVLVCFGLLSILWICRDPQCIPGFGALFKPGYYTDGTSAIFVAVLLFLLPATFPKLPFFSNEDEIYDKKNGKNGYGFQNSGDQRLMDWTTMKEKFPWNVVLLLGGGFALASGVAVSGLSELMGSWLAQFQNNPIWILQLICIAVTMLATNICSNTVTASIFVPVVATMAQKAGVHPLALMLPTTLACSFAFVLPVGCPSNAIAFSSGLLNAADMIISGTIVSLTVTVLVISYLSTFAGIIFPGIDQLSTNFNATDIIDPLLKL